VKWREWVASALLATVGILFGLVLLEVGVRFLHLVPDRFWEPDPVRGVRLIAGKSGWWTQEDHEFLVPVQINGEGLRDVEHTYAKPPRTFRVLVLGDSFVEAMHVPLEATFARLLEGELNADGATGHIEVVSAGVSGYGTAGELLLFEQEGQRYQPDLVVLAFYPGNDVKNNSPTLEDTLKPQYAADGSLQRVVSTEHKTAVHGWRGWIARSAAYHYFRQVLLVQHPQLAQRLVRLGLLKRDAVKVAPQRDGIPVDYGIYAPALSSEWQEAWQHTETLLGRLQQSVSASGARLAIAVLSSRDQVYPNWWQEITSAHPAMQGRQWDLDAPQHRVEAWCIAHDVPCVALTPPFRETAGRDGEPLHFHHDGHFTVAGHRLAATVLKDFLEQRRLVPVRQ
jgi:lysophospholipase L1-like esterase